MTESVIDLLSRTSKHAVTPDARILGLCLANGLSAGSLRLGPQHFVDPKLRAVFELMLSRYGRAIQPDEIDNYRAKTDEISKQLVELYERAGGRLTMEEPKDEIARLANQLRGETAPPAPPTQPTLGPDDIDPIEWAKGNVSCPFFLVADACELHWNVKLANAGEIIRFMVKERLLGPGQVAVQFKQYLHAAASSGSFAPPSPPLTWPEPEPEPEPVEPDVGWDQGPPPGWDQGPPPELEREPDPEEYEPPEPAPIAKKAKSAKEAKPATKRPKPLPQRRIHPDSEVLAGDETIYWFRAVPRLQGLNDKQYRILSVIASFVNYSKGYAWVSRRKIAEVACSCPNTAKRAIDRGVELGVFADEQVGPGRRTNKHWLALPKDIIAACREERGKRAKRRGKVETAASKMEAEHPSASPLSPGSPAPRPAGPTPGPTPRSSPIAPDWQPTDGMYRWALDRFGTDEQVAEQIDRFRAYHISKRTVRADWNGFFQGWCRRDRDNNRSTAKAGKSPRRPKGKQR